MYLGYTITTGRLPGRSAGREALPVPWDPPTTAGVHTGRMLAPTVKQHHLCPLAIKECGASPFAQRGHGAGTAPIVTLFIPETPLKATHLQKRA